VASTRGMQRTVETSTLFAERIHRVVPDRLDAMKRALEGSDFPAFAEITMKDSNQFHATCLDTFPPIHYLTDASHEIMDLVHSFCDGGGGACYTFDAGPNAVLMFPDSETMEAFVDFAGIKSDTVSSPLASLKSKILDGSVVVGPKVKMVIHAQVSKTGPIIVLKE
jgi:diphosphomevalonate decarboxylase